MNAIRRGTTPLLTCRITDNTDISNIKTVWLYITQGDKVVIDKLTDDVTISGKSVSVRLTQEETLLLKAGVMAYVQMRLLLSSDLAYATQQDYVPVEDVGKDGVIV